MINMMKLTTMFIKARPATTVIQMVRKEFNWTEFVEIDYPQGEKNE